MIQVRPSESSGGVGSLSSLGPRALELQKSFLAKLGLNAPVISWTTARDTQAEWFNLLALIASTGDKIGHEIYNLQRSEIGEVSEPDRRLWNRGRHTMRAQSAAHAEDLSQRARL